MCTENYATLFPAVMKGKQSELLVSSVYQGWNVNTEPTMICIQHGAFINTFAKICMLRSCLL